MHILIGNIFGSDGLIVLMVALVVLFGGSQLPKLAKNVGAAGHEFRKAQREAEAEHAATTTEIPALVELRAPALASGALRPPAAAEVSPLTRSDVRQELAKLLNERDKPTAG